jgi:hypothetical protein
MSPPTKKRPAEEAEQAPAAKRAALRKPQQLEVIEVEEEETYHVAVTLHSKYAIYPALLRKILENSYRTAVRSQMSGLATNTLPKGQHKFAVISELRVRSSSPNAAVNRTILKDNVATLSFANTTLVEMFLKAGKKHLEKPASVQLKTEEGIANPEFIHHHSVRRDEIGWGFDINMCLSLYVVFKENARLHEYAMFVERTEVKVEEV